MFSKNVNIDYFEGVARRLPPAFVALFLQVVSFIFFLFLSVVADNWQSLSLPLPFLICAHAAMAALLSYLFRMEWWWCWIQFSFPLLIVLFSLSGIPPIYYLSAFVLFALLYWSVFRTRVPYYPSKSTLVPLILDLLPPDKTIKFIDVGSGLGGLLIKLSKLRVESQFYGIEIAPLPWVISYLRSKVRVAPVHFTLGSYNDICLREYDVVFAYLSPVAMPDLWVKARDEMRPGSILLSYEFMIPNVEPDLCLNLNANEPILYLWRI